jgi:hypothetical protein
MNPMGFLVEQGDIAACCRIGCRVRQVVPFDFVVGSRLASPFRDVRTTQPVVKHGDVIRDKWPEGWEFNGAAHDHAPD